MLEEEISKLNIPFISIYRPGALINRKNDYRLVESILKYIPFISKIPVTLLAKAMVTESVLIANRGTDKSKNVRIYGNSEIKKIVPKNA